MFTKPAFTYFEISPYPNTFCKNNPKFFCNYKNTVFICTLNFQKLHINTHELYTTNTYFILTNIYLTLQVHELSHSGTHDHPLQRSDLDDEHPRSSSDESVRPSGSLAPAVPAVLPPQQYPDQIPASRQSDPNTAEFCTSDRTRPRRETSSDWPDNYCYTRTLQTAGIYLSW
jgi:hypothetical protein